MPLRICKSLYYALEKNESLGLGLSEKRTSIEVTATRQQMRTTGIKTKWVKSDRQLADVLTKATAPPASVLKFQHSGRWNIVWDATYTAAKNVRKAKRNAHSKKVSSSRGNHSAHRQHSQAAFLSSSHHSGAIRQKKRARYVIG